MPAGGGAPQWPPPPVAFWVGAQAGISGAGGQGRQPRQPGDAEDGDRAGAAVLRSGVWDGEEPGTGPDGSSAVV